MGNSRQSSVLSVCVPCWHLDLGLSASRCVRPYITVVRSPNLWCLIMATQADGNPSGFQGGTGGQEFACQCRRHEGCGFDPWVGRIPWSSRWHPAAVLLPGEPHGQRSLAGCRPSGHTESDTTECLSRQMKTLVLLLWLSW